MTVGKSQHDDRAVIQMPGGWCIGTWWPPRSSHVCAPSVPTPLWLARINHTLLLDGDDCVHRHIRGNQVILVQLICAQRLARISDHWPAMELADYQYSYRAGEGSDVMISILIVPGKDIMWWSVFLSCWGRIWCDDQYSYRGKQEVMSKQA